CRGNCRCERQESAPPDHVTTSVLPMKLDAHERPLKREVVLPAHVCDIPPAFPTVAGRQLERLIPPVGNPTRSSPDTQHGSGGAAAVGPPPRPVDRSRNDRSFREALVIESAHAG